MDVKNVKNVLRKEKHMNKTSKLLSLLLVLAIVFSLSVTALAADTTYTITVNGSGTVADHTFEAYQISRATFTLRQPEKAETPPKFSPTSSGATALTPTKRALKRISPSLPLQQQNC